MQGSCPLRLGALGVLGRIKLSLLVFFSPSRANSKPILPPYSHLSAHTSANPLHFNICSWASCRRGSWYLRLRCNGVFLSVLLPYAVGVACFVLDAWCKILLQSLSFCKGGSKSRKPIHRIECTCHYLLRELVNHELQTTN